MRLCARTPKPKTEHDFGAVHEGCFCWVLFTLKDKFTEYFKGSFEDEDMNLVTEDCHARMGEYAVNGFNENLVE